MACVIELSEHAPSLTKGRRRDMEYSNQEDFEEHSDGECEACGSKTIEGEAFNCCYYGSIECDVCRYATCDQSC